MGKLKGISKIIISAGIFFLFAAMLGACAYSSCVFDSNSYVQYNYGRDGSIYKAILSTACLAGIGCAVALTSIILMFLDCKSLITLIFYIITMVLFVGCLISESITLDYTKYGGQAITDSYNYPEDEEFQNHLKYCRQNIYGPYPPTQPRATILPEPWRDYSSRYPSKKVLKGVPYDDVGTSSQYAAGRIDAFTVQYTNPYYDFQPLEPSPDFNNSNYAELSIASCAYMDSDPNFRLLTLNRCFYGDPFDDMPLEECEISINQPDNYSCIGGWNLERYASWMQDRLRRQAKAYKDEMGDYTKIPNTDEMKSAYSGYASSSSRNDPYVNLNTVYEITAIFLGLQISGFVLLLAGIILNCVAGGKGVVGA